MATQSEADKAAHGLVQSFDHKLVNAKFGIVTNSIVVTTVRS